MSKSNDLELYEDNAGKWWSDDKRVFRSLLSVGRFHLELIREEWGLLLDGAEVVDLGCGGGALAIALAELGATSIGVDRSPSSVRAATEEAEQRGVASRFLCADLCATPLPDQSCDLVVMSDVLEHVESPRLAIREASRLLRPGGRFFLSTFDRSLWSRIAVVGLAETLGFVPRGTHDASMFVKPEEVRKYAAEFRVELERLVWERPAILRSLRTWTIHLKAGSSGLGYSAFLAKENV